MSIEDQCRELGGFIEQMGGGLTAWMFEVGRDNERYALITYHDGEHDGPADEAAWMAGLYDNTNGIQIKIVDEKTFDEALAMVAAWQAGDDPMLDADERRQFVEDQEREGEDEQ